MTQIEQIIAEIERLKAEIPYHENAWSVLNKLKGFINSLPAEQPKLKVRYAGKIYDVIRIAELSCGITMYGIEDEPNNIDYVLPENCEIISDYGYGVKEKGSPYPTKSALFSEQLSEDLDVEINLEYKSNYKLKELTLEEFRRIIYYFANWQKEQTINKASQWLNENVVEYHPRKGELKPVVNINAFREAMEKEDEQC